MTDLRKRCEEESQKILGKSCVCKRMKQLGLKNCWYCSVRIEVAHALERHAKKAEEVKSVIELAHKRGWNGVENSKILSIFLEWEFKQLERKLEAAEKWGIEQFKVCDEKIRVLYTENTALKQRVERLTEALRELLSVSRPQLLLLSGEKPKRVVREADEALAENSKESKNEGENE